MHILVVGPDVERVFQYCDQHDIMLFYGVVDYHTHELAWQIMQESSSHLDILLLMFPETLQVLVS